MTPWTILIIILVVILIVWWLLLQNAKDYKPDFPLEHEEDHAGHEAEAEHEGEPEMTIDEMHGEATAEIEVPAVAIEEQQVELPAVEAAVPSITVEEPHVELPAVELPAVEVETPSIDLEAPKFEAIADADIEAPSITIREPHMEIPAVDLEAPSIDLHAPRAEAISVPGLPDDLTIVEGIGPKVNQILHAAGIGTFAQLAEAAPDRLRAILEDARLGFMDPATWPEQARLAWEGKLDELKDYQDRLTGGKDK